MEENTEFWEEGLIFLFFLSHSCELTVARACKLDPLFTPGTSEVGYLLSDPPHPHLWNTWRSSLSTPGLHPRHTQTLCGDAAGRQTRSTCGSLPPRWPCTEQTLCEHLWWGSSPGDQKTSLWWRRKSSETGSLDTWILVWLPKVIVKDFLCHCKSLAQGTLCSTLCVLYHTSSLKWGAPVSLHSRIRK